MDESLTSCIYPCTYLYRALIRMNIDKAPIYNGYELYTISVTLDAKIGLSTSDPCKKIGLFCKAAL